MKLKIALVSATALAMTMGVPAYAQDNKAYLDQLGDDNTGLITQGGSGNIAGGPVGTSRILQHGDNHDLMINQEGNNNRAGTISDGINQGQAGNSTHSNNILSIDQLTNLNHVNIVYQSST